MMIRSIVLLCFVLYVPMQAVQATDQLTVGGTYLGVFNALKGAQTQFDMAVNLDVTYQVSDALTGVVQLQSGAGNGTFGFAGPNAVVTDLSIEYTPSNHSMQVVFGSFDTPFGTQTASLTNNADTFKQPFFLNALVYAALAGPVGTLNTLGVQLKKDWGVVQTVSTISNGTREDAYNARRTFELGLQVSNQTLIDGLKISGSVLRSDDRGDAQGTSDNHGLHTDLTAWILDMQYAVMPNHTFSAHYGQLTYDDHNASTNDAVRFYAIEYGLKHGEWFGGVRLSHWDPNATPSKDIRQPGLSSRAGNGESIQRIQVACGAHIDPRAMIKVAFVHDDYQTGEDVYGVISGVNVQF